MEQSIIVKKKGASDRNQLFHEFSDVLPSIEGITHFVYSSVIDVNSFDRHYGYNKGQL